MRIVTLDFETYFDSDYTLSKMTTEEYVRDPRFEAHGAAIWEPPTSRWLRPDDLRAELAKWAAPGHEPVALLAHHAQFDGLILSHHYGYMPDHWLCTLSMARVMFDQDKRKGLEALASRFGLEPKSVPYNDMRGKRWADMDPYLQSRVAAGAQHDCVLERQLLNYMMGWEPHSLVPYPFPPSELSVLDMTIRMFTEPCLVGDIELLGQAWQEDRKAQTELFMRLADVIPDWPSDVVSVGAMLRKDAVFAAALEALGVEPEQKTTAKGNEKWAFAKSDYFMQDLVDDEDPDVAMLAEARLKAQSSIYRTRIERYGDMALRGAMCVYLAYAAAHTRRWGGGDKTNFQNLPRPDKLKPQKGALRRALKAP